MALASPKEAVSPSWKESAEAQILKVRKGTFKIELVDPDGKPLPDLSISLKQVSHDFRIGCVAPFSRVLGTTEDDIRWRAEFNKHFNVAWFRDDLNWNSPAYTAEQIQQVKDWITTAGVSARGGALSMGSAQSIPEGMSELVGDTLRQDLMRRTTTMVEAWKGKIYAWDAVSGAATDRDLWIKVGDAGFAEMFKTLKKADPAAYAVYSDSQFHSDRLPMAMRRIDTLLMTKSPLDILGDIVPLGDKDVEPTRMIRDWNWLGKYQRRIEIFPFWRGRLEEDDQVKVLDDFLTAAFSHESVDGVFLPAFWQADGMGYLARSDWSSRPALQAMDEFLKVKYRSDAAAKSGTDGIGDFSLFYGTYEMSVVYNNTTYRGLIGFNKFGKAKMRIELSKS